MLKKSLVSILLLTLYLGSCILIYNLEIDNNVSINTTSSSYVTTNNKVNSEIIGSLTIEKINLTKDIYSIDSSHNNVEENVTILNDDDDLIVLAAHSGSGAIAYFDDLDLLELNDIINLTYNDKDLVYKVIDIEEQVKDGTIEINKTDEKRLILTTCSKKDKNKQLVITSQLIKDD